MGKTGIKKGKEKLGYAERERLAQSVYALLLYDVYTEEEQETILEITEEAAGRFLDMSPLAFVQKLRGIAEERGQGKNHINRA